MVSLFPVPFTVFHNEGNRRAALSIRTKRLIQHGSNFSCSLLRKLKHGAFALLMLLSTAATARDAAEPVTVYTVSALPVSVPKEFSGNIAVIHLDRAAAIEEELARGIHALAPEARLEAVQGRFTPALQEETVRLWQALGWVREHATHLPAIRIGDRSLYYGFDIRRAMALHRQAGGE